MQRCPLPPGALVATLAPLLLPLAMLGGGTARAQIPFRPVGMTDPLRLPEDRAAQSTDSASARAAAPSVNGLPGSTPTNDPRFFGTDARSLGADGRILGADGRIIYPPPLEQPLDPEHYLVDKGDVLQARVWGAQNFDISLPVDPDGRMFIPRVGYVMGHGRTLAAVSADVVKRLQERFPKLHMAVMLATPRTFLVRVTGAVRHPGSTLPANAWTRASEVIEHAGGIVAGGSHRLVELHHADGTVDPVDLVLYPLFGDRSKDPLVLDGDWIHVPLAQREVTIAGAVNRPGTYELLHGSFDELLKLAGGLTPEVDDQYGMRVASVAGDARTLRLVGFRRDRPEGIALELHHHDVVTVPTVDEGARVVVKGALGATRDDSARVDPRIASLLANDKEQTVALPFVVGETVRSAILKAGGLAPWADLNNAWVEHAITTEQVGKPGAQTAHASDEEALSRGSAGRAAERAPAKRTPIDLRALFSSDDRSHDVPLQPGDTIYVPSTHTDVTVSGHVMKPGRYDYSLRLSAEDYVALAGGASRDGTAARAKVVSLDGESRPLRPGMPIQPGDSIVVPGKVLTAAELVSISLGVVSVGLSAALLGYNLSR